MNQHPVTPCLLDLLKGFLHPIRIQMTKGRRKVNAFHLAEERHYHLTVFLENFVGQIFENEFDLQPPTDLALAYSALQKRLHEEGKGRKLRKSLMAVGKAMSPILRDWTDIKGTGYVTNKAIYPGLIRLRIPKLLNATLTLAEERKDVKLVKRLKGIVSLWSEVFNEN